ncbi:MAG: iron ABC transporter permease, partial [Verrucomicrobia bacterium]|nr:iron ABC transporter permease [Verrucomicrobiota bacterium]
MGREDALGGRMMMAQQFIITLWLLAGMAWSQTTTNDGFAIPQAGKTVEFPRDHGSHPEFRTDWWYLTGHLD